MNYDSLTGLVLHIFNFILIFDFKQTSVYFQGILQKSENIYCWQAEIQMIWTINNKKTRYFDHQLFASR